ncbi:DNA primase family protein [Metabacillus malikii]|uniref:DNA primase/helicase n=1 Tax=Metabacillus malikii TaxID=1504265 RepID=A0ABT9ZCP4_9BACI|nr:DUF5906 domain-containing protein [Metabacillus malikii]MDQ0229699.1 putative DNA primase/helicase [Metabacillus malikii]
MQAKEPRYIEFIDNEKYPRNGADISDIHETFNSCGWILDEDELVVDIDNLEKSKIEKIISTFDIKTQIVWTNRGAHFYFKKPKGFKGAKKVCPLGFEVEYKHSKNTKATTIKQNGVLRPIEYEGNREELPDIFYTKRRLNPVQELDEGEGRNDTLYQHRMNIHHLNQWQSILWFINNHIFATPLPGEEFQNIIRDNVKIKAEKNNEYDVAMQLRRKLKVVKFSDRLYSFNGNHYHDGIYFENDVACEIAGQKMRYITEVINQIGIHTLPIEEPSDGWGIKFKNGYLHDGHWVEIDFKEFTPFYIGIPYKPDAEPVAIVDDFLETFTDGDEDYKSLILETIAHCLITNIHVKRNKHFQRVTFFIGDGSNGKGTLLNVIRALLGTENVSSISLDRIIDERYLVTMRGKLANCGDDIENKAIKEEKMKMLKNLSSYDVIPLRELFKQSKDESILASQIFTTNHLLKSFEKGEAWKRRVVWCPSFGRPKVYDPHFQEKLTSQESMEYWLKLVMEAYFRLYKNRKFTESEKVKEYTELYHKENNSCIEWVRDVADVEKDIIGMKTPETYLIYAKWAEENGLNLQSPKQLKKTIEEELGLYVQDTSRDGESAKLWARAPTKKRKNKINK